MKMTRLYFILAFAVISVSSGFAQNWTMTVTGRINCNYTSTNYTASFAGGAAQSTSVTGGFSFTFTSTNGFVGKLTVSGSGTCVVCAGSPPVCNPNTPASGTVNIDLNVTNGCYTTSQSGGNLDVQVSITPPLTLSSQTPTGNLCDNSSLTFQVTSVFSSYIWQYQVDGGSWTPLPGYTGNSITAQTIQNIFGSSYTSVLGKNLNFQCIASECTSLSTGVIGPYVFYAKAPTMNTPVLTSKPTCPGDDNGSITIVHPTAEINTSIGYTYTVVQWIKKANTSDPCTANNAVPPPQPVPDWATQPADYCPMWVSNAQNGDGTSTNPATSTFILDNTKMLDTRFKFKPGLYSIKVEATSGGGTSCFTIIENVKILDREPVSVSTSNLAPPACNMGNDGTATFNIVTNGKYNSSYDILYTLYYETSPGVYNTVYDGRENIGANLSAEEQLTVDNLPAGKYKIKVTDKCTSYPTEQTFEIAPSNNYLTLSTPSGADKLNPTCYTADVGNGSFTITVNKVGDYTSDYTFKLYNNDDLAAGEVTGITKTVNNSFSVTYDDLNHGVNYKVEVTSPNGCTDSEIVTLGPPPGINGSSEQTDNTCHGGTSGIIRFNQSSGSANLSYGLEKQNASSVYQPFTGTLDAPNKRYTGLPAGVYRLTVTDNCLTTSGDVTFTKVFTGVSITEPDALEFVTTSDVILKDDEYSINCVDGTKDLTLKFRFGTAPYTVTLIKDTTTPISVGNGPSVSLSLGIGDYSVTVSDNCNNPLNNISLNFAIKSLATLPLTAAITKADLTCPERDDGSLQVDITGGIPDAGTNPYIVELLDNLGDPLTATITNTNNSYLISNLAENIAYTVRVKDYNSTPNPPGGCIKDFDRDLNADDLSLYAPQPLEIDPPDKNTDFTGLALFENELYAICKGDQNGVYRATISGGNAPYTVNLFKKALDADPWLTSPFAFETNVVDNTAVFSGLDSGLYKVEVTDLQNCQFDAQFFEIKEAAASIQAESITAFEFPHGANTKCHNTSDGSITIQASGGVGNYTYFITGDEYIQPINRPETLHTFPNLAAKKANGEVINYTISLRDTLGCPWSMTNGVKHQLELSSPDTVKFSWDVISDVAPGYEIPCRDDEAVIRVTSDGGHFPHEISISSQIVQSLSDSTDVADFSLGANTYTASFTDALGCPAPDQTIILNEPATHIAATAGTISFPICVGNNDGEIEVSAAGGIPFPNPNEFQFVIRETGASTFDTDTLRGTNVTFFRPANYSSAQDYEIMSIDAHGCSDTIPVTMPVNPDPLTLTSVEQVSPSCYGGTDGYITVSASNYDLIGGTSLRFKLSGGHLGNTILDTVVDGNTVTFNNLHGTDDLNSYGAYRAWVEDANNCQDTAYQYLDDLFLPSYEPITASLIKSIRPSCFNGTDGSLLVKISGGVPPYRYSLDSVTFFNVNPTDNRVFIDNLAEGTYTFYVIDSNYQPTQPTCTNTTPFDVEPGRFIRLETNPSAVSCVGGNDGAIDLTVNLDNRNSGENFESGRFSLFWTYDNLSPTDTISVQEDVSGLSAGRYTVHATYNVDSLTCVNQASATIRQPASGAFRISDIVTYDASCGGLTNDGIATVNITGGWADVPSYYRLDNASWVPFSNSSFMLSGLSPGTHSIEISQSAFACNDASSFAIGSASIELTLQQIIKPSCPLNADGTVVLSSPSSNVLFAIEGDAFPTLGVFKGLAKGTYRFIARDNTLATCTSEVLEVIVDDPVDCGQGPLSLILGATSPATCTTVQDGRAEVIASGGVPPYQIYWDGSTVPTSSAIDNLAPGSHTVTVTDAVGASLTETVVIDIPDPITFQSFTNRASCAASCDGTAALLIEGGSENYTIAWPGGFTTTTRENLCAGQYDFTISDVRNPECVLSGSVLIEPYPELQIDLLTARAPVCPGGIDGYLDTNVSGGSGDYTVNWNNSTPGERLDGQVPGDYTIAVTDNVLGCTKEMTFTLPDATPITVLSATITSPKCFGGNDGKIVLDPGNVSSPLVEWDNGQIGLTASGLQAGTYGYTITGASGCSITGSEVVEERAALTVTPTSVMPTCFNFCNGSAALAITGGAAPFAIRWSHGPRISSVANLCAGTYFYTVTDNLSCQVSGTIVIDNPAEINITKTSDIMPACFGDSNGSITIEASGGTGDFAYNWASGETSPSITGLTAGDYTVTVTDENQCIRNKTFSLTGPSALLLLQDKVTFPSCAQSTDGKIIPNPVGGTSPLTYLWNDQSTALIKENLSAGQYTLRVTDAKGCTVQKTYGLQAPSSLAIVNVVPRDPLCFDDENGSISTEAIGGTGPYAFSWNTNATTSTINDLGAGQYILTVTDKNGCTSITSYTLNNPAQPFITGIPEKITICIGSPTTVEPEGEWRKYLWTGPQNFVASTRRIETSLSGNYSLTALNMNDCPAQTNFTIEASKDALVADFLRLTEAVVYEPVVFVDISLPQPTTLQWITPDNNDVVVNKQSKENIEIVFTRSGTFEIGMIATMGTCRSEIYKTVVVAEADENPDNSGGRMAIEDRPMSALVYPNPAREEIAIQVAVPSRDPVDIWLISPVENRAFFHERNQGQFDYLIEWNISKLTTGVYHLIYKQNNTTRSERIAVIR